MSLIEAIPDAQVRPYKVLTVLLQWPEHRVLQYIDQYLEGAKTRQVGRFCAVQHPMFAAYGEDGLWDVAYSHKLPVFAITRASPL